MAVTARIKDLAPGTVLNAGPVEARILKHYPDGKTLLVSDECIADRHFADEPFKLKPEKPEHNPNDWRFSNLRHELNTTFLDAFDQADGFIKSKDILTVDWNLADHNGGEGYGVIQDKICLLTEAMVKEFEGTDLLELDDWWWTVTPHAGNSNRARLVSTDGSLHISYAYRGHFGVRPAFFVESGITLKLSEEEVNLADSVLLGEFTTRQLVEEIFRRIGGDQEAGDDNDELPY